MTALTASASAQSPAPSLTGFSASANPVRIADPTVLTATVDRNLENTGYVLAIVDVDAGYTMSRCGRLTSCSRYLVPAGYENNKDLVPRRFRAELRVASSDAVIASQALTVEFTGRTWKLTSLTASPNPVRVDQPTTVTARIDSDIESTGYEVAILDEDTGALRTRCTRGTSCTPFLPAAGWIANAAPPVWRYRAEVRNPTTGHLVDTAYLEIPNAAVWFRVNLSFTPLPSDDTGARWRATATASEAVSDANGYRLEIWNSSGTRAASCVRTSSCTTDVRDGSYYAIVRGSDGIIFGRSGTWRLGSGQPEDLTAEGIDLYALAAAFPTVTNLCEVVLTGPGTHAAGSSVSDQYLACEAASAGGKISALKAIVASGGAVAILYYLTDYVDRHTDASTTTVPPTVEPPPPTRPFVPVPSSSDDDIDAFYARNATAFGDRRTAKLALDTCRTVASRENCLDLPIILPGNLKTPETTRHNRTAIFGGSQPAILRWAAPADRAAGGWYDTLAARPNPCEGRNASVYHCDEYPFRSTLQGGLGASLRPTPAAESGSQGSSLGVFYTACRLNATDAPSFIVAPLPAGAPLPTLHACNGR